MRHGDSARGVDQRLVISAAPIGFPLAAALRPSWRVEVAGLRIAKLDDEPGNSAMDALAV
jgi:hypothetical protein